MAKVALIALALFALQVNHNKHFVLLLNVEKTFSLHQT